MTTHLLISFPCEDIASGSVRAKFALTPKQESILERAAIVSGCPLSDEGVKMVMELDQGNTMITTPTDEYLAANKRPRG